MSLTKGTILQNRYHIDEMLSRGGMGAVYRAYDTNLQVTVAIKENLLQTEQAVELFKHEALILARLRHPALPRVTHHFSAGGKQYLVMDFVEGEELEDIVNKNDPSLDEGQAIDYIVQVCGAVHYLHQQDPPIIHRDIKPRNIKITSAGQAVLVDFGIAKQYTDDGQTRTGARQAGTLGYSPLEQFSGKGTTPVSDVYALGATLYTLLTGKKPVDSLNRAVDDTLMPPDKLNPKLNPKISEAILHAMKLQPIDRPQSVTVWQETLQNTDVFVEKTVLSEPTQLHREPGEEPTSKPRSRLRWPIGAIGVILAGLALVFFSGVLQPQPDFTPTPQPVAIAPTTQSSIVTPTSLPTNTPLPDLAVKKFTANPTSIIAGQNVTLEWVVEGAESVAVAPVGAGYPSVHRIDHAPLQDTEYILRASRGGDEITETLKVFVTVPATDTPVPPTTTDTPTPSPTATPTSTQPIPTATSAVSPTPAATNTPALPTGEFVLLKPASLEEPTFGMTTFEWQWDSPLAENQGFEVRVWRDDEPAFGVHNSVSDNQDGTIEALGDNTYRLVADITDTPGVLRQGGEYNWTVLLIQLDPYQELGVEATPGRLRFDLPGGPGGGGGNGGGSTPSGGIN